MEKLIDYLGLDQYGTNFPKEIYDPGAATNTLEGISKPVVNFHILIQHCRIGYSKEIRADAEYRYG
jgi:hypothetical protein